MTIFPIVQGFVLAASMIIPIGAQNAFVLNQGIKRQHHFVAASICMLSDFILIAIGIYGGSQIINSSELAFTILTWAGIVFLVGYGILSFKSAIYFDEVSRQAEASELNNSRTLSKVILTCLAVTLLNPHVYLDTVIILGGVGGQFESNAKLNFTIGCMLASLTWFYGLALLASKMSDYLSRRKVKTAIDIVVGLIMWVIAGMLFSSWNYANSI